MNLKYLYSTDLFEELDEDIEKHDELNPKLFDENNMLKDEVREKVEAIVTDFTKELAEDGIKIAIDDIILIGSNVNYNYTKDSDLDVHIIANTRDTDCPDNLYPVLYSAYRSLYNKAHDINFYGIPVELYVETEDSARKSNGEYSVRNNKWNKEPVKEDIPDINMEEFDATFAEWEERYNKISETPSLDDIITYIEDIYKIRQEALADEGEYAIGNLIFKEVRNRGWLDILKELQNQEISKELSLESLDASTIQEALDLRDGKTRTEIRIKITQAVHSQPIIQDNGLFHIYNVRESDVNNALMKLRNLDFIDQHYLQATPGKFDFSHFNGLGTPPRAFTITGRIITE